MARLHTWNSLFLVPLAACLSACGTFSHLRPADPIPKGATEVVMGVGVNSRPQLAPAIVAARGLGADIEALAQWELNSALAALRWAPFTTRVNNLALSFTLGGGWAKRYTADLGDSLESESGSVAVIGATFGRRFDANEFYMGFRLIGLLSQESAIQSYRLGLRFPVTDMLSLGLEGGLAVHSAQLSFAEGTVAVLRSF